MELQNGRVNGVREQARFDKTNNNQCLRESDGHVCLFGSCWTSVPRVKQGEYCLFSIR